MACLSLASFVAVVIVAKMANICNGVSDEVLTEEVVATLSTDGSMMPESKCRLAVQWPLGLRPLMFW